MEEPFAFHPVPTGNSTEAPFPTASLLHHSCGGSNLRRIGYLFETMPVLVCINPVITLNQSVLGRGNMACFTRWAQTAPEGDLIAAINTVYIVYHSVWDDDYDTPDQRFPDVSISRADLGRDFAIKTKSCDDNECHRCLIQCGGWGFPFIGPWTCRSLVGNDQRMARDQIEIARSCQCGMHWGR